jgi:hypothetical protein
MKRIPPANVRSSSGCFSNHSHTDIPCTRWNALLPVRMLSVRSAQAAVPDGSAM